jgi:hypothetical protein
MGGGVTDSSGTVVGEGLAGPSAGAGGGGDSACGVSGYGGGGGESTDGMQSTIASTNQSSSPAPVPVLAGGPAGSIALCVQCSGSDKLIHVSGIAVPFSGDSSSISRSGGGHGGGGGGGQSGSSDPLASPAAAESTNAVEGAGDQEGAGPVPSLQSGSNSSSSVAPNAATATNAAGAMQIKRHSFSNLSILTGGSSNNLSGSNYSSSSSVTSGAEQVLLDKVDAFARKDFAKLLEYTDAHSTLYLRSKLPRKVPSTTGGKPMHSVAFSKDARVQAASRKNLVLDAVPADHLEDAAAGCLAKAAAAAAAAVAAEWSTEGAAAAPPMLQVRGAHHAGFKFFFLLVLFVSLVFHNYFIVVSSLPPLAPLFYFSDGQTG